MSAVNISGQLNDLNCSVTNSILQTKQYRNWQAGIFHYDCRKEISTTTSGHDNFIPTSTTNNLFQSRTVNTLVSSAILLPQNPVEMFIISTSANDTISAGSGCQNVLIGRWVDENYSNFTVGVFSLNGTTQNSIGTCYRIGFIETLAKGASGSNEGEIRIQNNGGTQYYPLVIPINSNFSVQNAIYIPRCQDILINGQLATQKAYFDYVFYKIDNAGGDLEILRVYKKTSNSSLNTWSIVSEFKQNFNSGFEIPLTNLQIDVSLSGYDFVWTIDKSTAGGQFNGQIAIGCHLE